MRKDPNKPVFLSISESLRKDILYGNMNPGKALIEKEIAERFHTSRAPVRESFRILEGEGLIVRNTHVGYRVREFNLEEFTEQNILLKIVEKEMLLRAIPHYTELDLCQMDQLVEKISLSASIEEFITHLIRFTEIVHEPSGWHFSIQLIKQIHFRNVPFYREIAKKFISHKLQLTTHKLFIDLCRKGKIQEAIDCWIVRYDNSEKQVFSANKKETYTEW